MKTVYKWFTTLLFISIWSSTTFAQNLPFDTLLNRGKAEFKKEFDNQDYNAAVTNLEKAVKLKPNNAEAHYFLGYAYSRLNSKDGTSMLNMNLPLLLKTSLEFETVIKLSPKYVGEQLILDPYSKLTAEWGSMAMTYWNKGNADSSIWAFNEGRKRGGFGDFYLSLNRKILDLCSQNAYLISSGDNMTIPLWYLQIVEGVRKDVSVIDFSLLNTTWYPSLLQNNKTVFFNITNDKLEKIDYCDWNEKPVSISSFTWKLKPSGEYPMLFRNERILLTLLNANNFKKDIFFTLGFPEESKLSLNEYLESYLVVEKLNVNPKNALSSEKLNTIYASIFPLLKSINKNSSIEYNFIDNVRITVLLKITKYLKEGNKKEAKELFNILEKNMPTSEYPYASNNLKEFADYLKTELE